MRSSKMDLNSNQIKIQFSGAMCAPYLELHFGENWTYSSRDIAILVLLKTIKYKEK